MTLRQDMRARRRALSASGQRHHAHTACRRLVTSAVMLRGLVAAYAAADGELNLWPFIARHPRIALPVVESAQRMTFRRYRLGDPLRSNRFGIAEPAGGVCVPMTALSVVLMPLVAFSDEGRRIGMGGGFYDRYFASTGRPLLVGVAHEFQRLDHIPHRDWDVPLDAVVTECGWRYFTARGKALRLY